LSTMAEEHTQEVADLGDETKSFNTQFKLFGKYDYSEVKVDDICFKDYIAVSTVKSQVFIPHTAGRWQVKKFRKAQCPIVERLVGSLMFHGRNSGKKNLAVRIVKNAFAIIQLMTGKNPVQVFIEAVQNGGARESSTRIGTGGVVRRQAVDVSPLKRANLSIYFMCVGARKAAFKNMKTIAECLADEIMNCAKNSPNSTAIRKRDDTEKEAKNNR
jgi:small subunit ribosomal protein S5e